MKQTRRALYAQNVQLQAQLVACGPDATMSRKQLRARIATARKEVDALTAQNKNLTARVDALTAELAELKAKKEETTPA